MKEKSRTEEFLNKVYENAEMCCESISMITEKVEDPSLLSELQSEHRDYTDLSGEAVKGTAGAVRSLVGYTDEYGI